MAKSKGENGGHRTAKTKSPNKFLLARVFTGRVPRVRWRGLISTVTLGAGGSHPKFDQIFNVFRLIVWRSTAAKPNEIKITFMPHFVRWVIMKLTCVTDLGYLAG